MEYFIGLKKVKLGNVYCVRCKIYLLPIVITYFLYFSLQLKIEKPEAVSLPNYGIV